MLGLLLLLPCLFILTHVPGFWNATIAVFSVFLGLFSRFPALGVVLTAMAGAVVAYVRAKRTAHKTFNEHVTKLVIPQPSNESCQSVWESAARGLAHPQLSWDSEWA